MWINGIEHIPSHYILKRWYRNANADVKRPINERSRDAGNSLALQMFRATTLKDQLNQLVDLASRDADLFNLVEAKVRELLAQVQPVPLKDLSQQINVEDEVAEETEVVMEIDVEDEVPKNSFLLHDPPVSKCKGRKKRPTHWKIAAEKAPINGRICSYCKLMAKHNIRTCPKKIEDEAAGKDIDMVEIDEENDEDEEYKEDGEDE